MCSPLRIPDYQSSNRQCATTVYANALSAIMVRYKVTYKVESPAEVSNIVFVVYQDVTRYTKQDPLDWYMERRAEWTGKKILSIEMVD